MKPSLATLRSELAPARERLLRHPIYASVKTLADIRTLQEHHVYAVWDFMSLLKALQRLLTCTEIPWRPAGDPLARRLVNEIVCAEESDEDGSGGFISHFELYLRSMLETGASTDAIEDTLNRVRLTNSLEHALQPAPPAARAFCLETFRVIRSGSIPAIAAAFTLGREDVIPEMFRQFVHDLQRQGTRVASLVDYLERHVAIDAERHAPMAEQMLASVCGDDKGAWTVARKAALSAIEARIAFWDGVSRALAPGHQHAT
jgi:hypothetical protein